MSTGTCENHPRERSVPVSMNGLETKAGDLRTQCASLVEALQPILRQESSVLVEAFEGPAKDKATENCDLATQASSIKDTLDSAANILTDITQRLEL